MPTGQSPRRRQAGAADASAAAPAPPRLEPFTSEHLDTGFLGNISLLILNLMQSPNFSWTKLAHLLSSPSDNFTEPGFRQLADALKNPQKYVSFSQSFSFTENDKKALRYLIIAFIGDMVASSEVLNPISYPQWKTWGDSYASHLKTLYTQVPEEYKKDIVIQHGSWAHFVKHLAIIGLGLIIPALYFAYITFKVLSVVYRVHTNPDSVDPRSRSFVQNHFFYLISDNLINILLIFSIIYSSYTMLGIAKPTVVTIKQFAMAFHGSLTPTQISEITEKYRILAVPRFKELVAQLKTITPTAADTPPKSIDISLYDSLKGSLKAVLINPPAGLNPSIRAFP